MPELVLLLWSLQVMQHVAQLQLTQMVNGRFVLNQHVRLLAQR
jgi:hypothetical protein